MTVILHRVILDCSDSLNITIPALRNNFGELLLQCQRNSTQQELNETKVRTITTFDGEIIIQFVSDLQGSAQGFAIEYALVEMLSRYSRECILLYFSHHEVKICPTGGFI